jgi:Putative Ig domain
MIRKTRERVQLRHAGWAWLGRKFFLACLLLAVIGSFSCAKEGNKTTSGGRTSSGSRRTTGVLTVQIVPGSPTVTTDLQALYTGAGKAVYQWARNGEALSGETGDKLSKGLFSKGDTVSVTVTSGGKTGTASVVIGNTPPKVVSVPFSPDAIHAGEDITVAPVGYDADGDEVRFHYTWSINGQELFEDSPVLAGNRFKRGDTVALTVVPSDEDGPGAPFVSQNMVIPDAAPQIVSSPPDVHGSVYTYQVKAADPDGDPVSYSLSVAPAGMVISAAGMITWHINEQSAGSHAVEITAKDPAGMKATQKFTLTIGMTEEGTNESK